MSGVERLKKLRETIRSSLNKMRISKVSCCEIPDSNQKPESRCEDKTGVDKQFCNATLTCNKSMYSCDSGACGIKGEKDDGRLRSLITLGDLREGQNAKVMLVKGSYKITRRLLDMGILPGTTISLIKIAPLGGAVEITVRGSNLALSRDISANVFVEPID